MSERFATPSEFTGWWLRLRRTALGVDRALLARRAAARGAARVTKTLIIDLELGRRQPNVRTLPELAFSLEMPAEILASLVLASYPLTRELERSVLFGSVEPESVPALRRAEGALLGGRFGRAFALAELAAVAGEGGQELAGARLAAASAAAAAGAHALACWRAGEVYERARAERERGKAALIFARAAACRGERLQARLWLDQAGVVDAPLDRAWHAIVDGRLALEERRYEHARAALMEGHEAARVAGSAWVAAAAARGLANTFEKLKRPDLAWKWRSRQDSWTGMEGRGPLPPRDRKTFG